MFSPIVAIASAIAASTVALPTFAALIFSMSAPTSSATCATILTRPWNCSLRATKSVSELTSTTTPLVVAVSAPIKPSAATRPAFFAAFDNPFLRSQSCAACMSPAVSVRAALQSIMPAPVDSRRSFTIAAVIVAIVGRPFACPYLGAVPARRAYAIRSLLRSDGRLEAGHRICLFRFCGQRLGLSDPGIGAARQADFFADLVRGVVAELGELPVMENAEVVELLLDGAGHSGELLEIVGRTTRTRQALETRSLLRERQFLARGMGGGSDVDPHLALGAGNAVDRRTRDEVAIKRNGAASIVVTGHDVGDALWIGVGVDDRGNRNVEPLRFGDRNVFLVGVDHKDHVRQAAHVLDATERTVELVALALQG